MENLSFQLNCRDISDFMEHWSSKYVYQTEHKYDDNIGKPLTEESRLELFEWKNGSVISAKKLESIDKNYPLSFDGDKAERYLNHRESGGAIWNIFYIHILEPSKWPIFDQHTFRAMRYIQSGQIEEIEENDKRKYENYVDEYMPFISALGDVDHRKLDKALFSFGQFLKLAKKYT